MRRHRTTRKTLIVPAIAAIALDAVACTSGSDSGSSSGTGSPGSGGAPIELTMCHGYGDVIPNQGQTNYQAKPLADLVDEFDAANPGRHVSLVCTAVNDHALEKLTVGMQRGRQPDIA